MFARVTTLQASPDQVDAATRSTREEVLPAARQLEGFRGLITLTDRSTGKAMAVTLWETEDAMKASEEAANRLRSQAASAMQGQVIGVERYEVTVLEI